MKKVLSLFIFLMLLLFPLFSEDAAKTAVSTEDTADPLQVLKAEDITKVVDEKSASTGKEVKDAGTLSSTWINVTDYSNLFYSTNLNSYLPLSMAAYVSSGIFYDEIDILIRHPSELSNYEGYSIFTAYGNQSYSQLSNTTDYVYPFTTNFVSKGNQKLTRILAGYVMPIFNFRAGIIEGFDNSQLVNLTIGSDMHSWSSTQTGSEDIDVNNVADYTWTNNETYTDYISGLQYTGGAGVDLGFMGVSLFLYIESLNRKLGGSYQFVDTAGETPYANDTISSKIVYYGQGVNGAVTDSYSPTPSTWGTKLTGDLPLSIAGLSMPVTASFILKGSSGGPATYNLPMTVNITANNVTGANATTASTSSISYTVGQAMAVSTGTGTGWNPSTTSGVLTGGDIFLQSDFTGEITTALAAGPALLKTGTNISGFTFGLEGNIDPLIPVNNILTIRTRAFLGYMINSDTDTESASRSINYSEANAVSATNSAFSFTETVTYSNTSITNYIDFEVGGILEFKDNNFLTVGTGFFYHPSFILSTNTHQGAQTTQNYSWQDQTNTDAVIAGGPAAADIIQPGSNQGSSTYTSTSTYDGIDTDNTIYHNFYIPVSLKLDFAKGKFSLIGGYTLKHSIMVENIVSPDIISTSATSLYASFDQTGTPVYQTAADAASNIEKGTESNSSSALWSGNMNFMLRFKPVSSMTFDIYGTTVMNALNFGIFGGGAGFNPSTFIGNLGISVSINIE